MLVEKIDLLNLKAKKLLGDTLSNNIKAVEFSSIRNGTSVTLLPQDAEVPFNLNPIVVGYVKNTPNNHSVSSENQAIWRGMIGYMGAVKGIEDDQYFMFLMVNLINQGLRELTLELGDLSFRKIILGFADGTHFRESESSAGYEFRMRVE